MKGQTMKWFKKSYVVIALLVIGMLSLTGCLWPSKADKLKIDSALISISEANVACVAGDCNACKRGIAEANSLFAYSQTWDAWASGDTKETLSQYAKAAARADNLAQADCNYAAQALPKLYNGVKYLRSLANGGADANK